MKALAKHSQMSTHSPGFQAFSGFLHHFVIAKLASSSIRVNCMSLMTNLTHLEYIEGCKLGFCMEYRMTHYAD